jgi:hypothetical protein
MRAPRPTPYMSPSPFPRRIRRPSLSFRSARLPVPDRVPSPSSPWRRCWRPSLSPGRMSADPATDGAPIFLATFSICALSASHLNPPLRRTSLPQRAPLATGHARHARWRRQGEVGVCCGGESTRRGWRSWHPWLPLCSTPFLPSASSRCPRCPLPLPPQIRRAVAAFIRPQIERLAPPPSSRLLPLTTTHTTTFSSTTALPMRNERSPPSYLASVCCPRRRGEVGQGVDITQSLRSAASQACPRSPSSPVQVSRPASRNSPSISRCRARFASPRTDLTTPLGVSAQP